MKQLLLNAKECTGRGVRVRTLSVEGRIKVSENAAIEVGKEGTLFQLRAREAIESVYAFVAEITEQTGFKTRDELIKAGAAAGWKKVTAEDLADNATKYFNSKDMSALSNVFKAMHDVTEKEVEDILGEAQEVTEA